MTSHRISEPLFEGEAASYESLFKHCKAVSDSTGFLLSAAADTLRELWVSFPERSSDSDVDCTASFFFVEVQETKGRR